MNDKQESNVTMVGLTMKALDNNQTVWADDADIAATKAQIEASRAKISVEHKAQTEKTHGAVEVKNNQRSKLTDSLVKVLDGMQAIAVKKGDLKLETDTHYTESGLKHMRQEQIPNYAEKVLQVANANKSELSKYINEEDITSLSATIGEFKEALKGPKDVKNKSKVSTANLDSLITETVSLLNRKMDKLVKPYEHTHPDFYHEYTNARKIFVYGTRSKADEKVETAEKE